MLIASAFRTDEDVRALAAVEALKRVSVRLPLPTLTPNAVETLTRSIFGRGRALKRVAAWIFDVSGGSPHHAIEVIRHIVDEGALSYSEGVWHVRRNVEELQQPGTLREALDKRVRTFPASVRALGLALLAGLESLDLQLAFPWNWRGYLVWMSVTAYGLNRDILGLRQMLSELERFNALGHDYRHNIELCRAHYYRERAQIDLAQECLDRAQRLPFTGFSVLVQQSIQALSAELALTRGDLDAAWQEATRAVGLVEQDGRGHTNEMYRGKRVLAFVKAHRGDHQEALAIIDAALKQAADIASPSISGLLHEAGAQIAWDAGQTSAFDIHLEGVKHWFEPTRNPALLARLEVLLSLGEHGDESEDEVSWPSLDQTAASLGSLARTIVTHGSPQIRVARAYELLMEATDAQEGFLLMPERSGVAVAAPLDGSDPGEQIRLTAMELFAGEVTLHELTQTTDVRLVPLSNEAGTECSALFVVMDDHGAFREPPAELTDQLGRLLAS